MAGSAADLHVPDADGLVLAVADDELLSRMEDDARHIVEVAATRVDLPRLSVCYDQQAK